jgi:hypothetical protein
LELKKINYSSFSINVTLSLYHFGSAVHDFLSLRQSHVIFELETVVATRTSLKSSSKLTFFSKQIEFQKFFIRT